MVHYVLLIGGDLIFGMYKQRFESVHPLETDLYLCILKRFSCMTHSIKGNKGLRYRNVSVSQPQFQGGLEGCVCQISPACQSSTVGNCCSGAPYLNVPFL